MSYLDLTGLGYFKDELVVDTLSQSGRAADAKAAGEAIYDSLPTDTASGSIASFTDGADGVPVEALTVSLEPKQDLHGQTSPYPAGGGVNKLDMATVTAHAPTQFGLAITITDTCVNLSGTWTGSASGGARTIDVPSAVRSYNIKAFESTGHVSARWQSGEDVIVFDFANMTNGSSYNLNVYLVAYEGSTAPTAWTPYSNICPITGHTQAQVWRAGKNLLEGELTTRTVNGTTFTVNSDGSITVSGTPTTQTRVAIKRGLIWNGVASVIFSTGTMPSGTRVFARRVLNGNTTYPTISETANITLGAEYYDFYLEINTTFSGATFTLYPQLELGSTASAYEEYNAVHISIPLGQTVYGGTIDVVGGVCRSNMAILELGNLNWTYDSGYNRFNVNGAWGQKTPANNETKANIVSDRYKTVTDNQTASTNYNCSIGMSLAGRLDIRDESFGSDVAAFKASLSGAQLCYELATPIEIPLTEQQLSTLYGQNNVWSDSGDTTVEYRADIGLYLQKVIAAALGS